MPMQDALSKDQGSNTFFSRIVFGGGLHTAIEPKDIDIRECAKGENFDLGLGVTSFKPRAAFDLVAQAPNAQAINGFAELIKSDGTITTLVQAGGNVYQWDGQNVFTLVGTINASSKMRGTRNSTSPVDNYVIITDLALKDTVKTWNGTTFADLTTNLGGDFLARYCVVDRERALFGNVQSGTATPHLFVASAVAPSATATAVGTLSVSDRPSSSLGTGDPFYIPIPDFKPINGLISAFGETIMSTEGGSVYRLTGSTAKDYDLQPLFPNSGAAGQESFAYIGNDVLYGRPGKIESLVSILAFSDVESDDVSRWITPDVKTVKSWTVVYNPRLYKAYLWAENGNEVYVFHKSIYDTQRPSKTLQDSLRAGGYSPWSKWTTTYGNQDFRPTCAMLVRRPTDGLDVVLMGDSQGRIFVLDGDGSQDGPATATNLCLQSADFSTTWATVNSSVTTNTWAALDGTTSADTLTDNLTNGEHAVEQSVTTAANAIYTTSVWFKAKEYSRGFIRMSANTGVDSIQAAFLLSGSGSIVSSANGGTGSGVSATIEQWSDGFYRCILSGTPATSGTTIAVRIGVVDASGNFAFAGTGSGGIYVWGAQLETGGVATPYIPTTSAAVTRTAAEITAFRTSGTLFSPWMGKKTRLGMEVHDLKGYVYYRKGFDAALTVTAQYEGTSLNDERRTVTLPAFSNINVFGGSVYFGGSYYFGTQYEGRISRQIFDIPGRADQFMLKLSLTGDQFDIPEVGIQYEAEAR